MAFPIVASSSLKKKTNLNNPTFTIDLPAGVEAGDGLLMFVELSGITGIANWGDFTELYQEIYDWRAMSLAAWRMADGTEGATTTITSADDSGGGVIILRIEKDTFEPFTKTLPEYNTNDVETDQNPNPPQVTPSWGDADALWVVTQGYNSLEKWSSIPANYANVDTVINSGSSSLTVEQRSMAASAENPGTYTMPQARNAVVATIAVAPKLGADGYSGFGAVNI